MLQQTQVDRVISYYKAWIQAYPTVHTLAQASLGEVLRHWQGLGYNRRAKMLHDAARTVAEEWNGKLPTSVEDLQRLPGVGPYTARAIAAFAHNQDVLFVETNLRTAVLHHFYTNTDTVPDSDVLHVLQKTYVPGTAREWYAALMDYGAHLKRSGVRNNAKRKGYIKQSTFKGSKREIRGAVLRAISGKPTSKKSLLKLFPDRPEEVSAQLDALLREKLIEKKRTTYTLPS